MSNSSGDRRWARVWEDWRQEDRAPTLLLSQLPPSLIPALPPSLRPSLSSPLSQPHPTHLDRPREAGAGKTGPQPYRVGDPPVGRSPNLKFFYFSLGDPWASSGCTPPPSPPGPRAPTDLEPPSHPAPPASPRALGWGPPPSHLPSALPLRGIQLPCPTLILITSSCPCCPTGATSSSLYTVRSFLSLDLCSLCSLCHPLGLVPVRP